MKSIDIVVMVILGGMGRTPGVIARRDHPHDLAEKRFAAFGEYE